MVCLLAQFFMLASMMPDGSSLSLLDRPRALATDQRAAASTHTDVQYDSTLATTEKPPKQRTLSEAESSARPVVAELLPLVTESVWSAPTLPPWGKSESSEPVFPRGAQTPLQKQVLAMMHHAWNEGYVKYCWGGDEFKPVSKGCHNGWHLGLTLVDSLDTLYLMGMDEEFAEARAWVADTEALDFSKVGNVNVFETSIRVIGGLLAAATLTGDSMFATRAAELGTRMLPAFQNRPPYSDIMVASGHAQNLGGQTSIGEAGTLSLEWRTLSELSGKPEYARAVNEVSNTLHALPTKDGLLHNSLPSGGIISLGARGDSYYEYLLKQWLLSDRTETVYLDDYMHAMQGVRTHLVKRSQGPMNLTYISELNADGSAHRKMDHLVCFLPGLLALGVHFGAGPLEDLALAKELMRTCRQMYVETGHMLGPEIAHFDTNGQELFVKAVDSHDLLRPETVESLFYLFRFTGDRLYQTWGQEIMEGIEKYAKVDSGGYTSLDNTLGTVKKRDKMESFFLAETLKYLFLLFDDSRSQLPLDIFVLSTEAHPFRMQRH